MAEAAAMVPDGARIALGGFAIYQHPMAFTRELIRQNKRDLTVVGVVNGPEVDMLAGAGCLTCIETSYVGLEKYGLAPSFRRKVEEGALRVVDYPELLSWDRFRASQENHTFLQASFLGGTDIVRRNADIKPFDCPLTGRKLWAVPPADPDIVVIHAILADAHGNVLMPERRLLPQSLDITLARSCDTVIVTAERIVDHGEIRRHAHLNEIPSYRTTCVVEAPWGAHPCPVLGHSAIDDDHFHAYVAASRTEDGMRDYLATHVFGVADHQGYLDLIGLARLLSLQTTVPVR
jgi:glutaconate CoA-transferase subunit A